MSPKSPLYDLAETLELDALVDSWRVQQVSAPVSRRPQPRARCTCYVLPHADDCDLLRGITQTGRRVFSQPGTFRPSLADIPACDCNTSPHRANCATRRRG